MGLKSCGGELGQWCSSVRKEAAEVVGAIQTGFLWQGAHDLYRKDVQQ